VPSPAPPSTGALPLLPKLAPPLPLVSPLSATLVVVEAIAPPSALEATLSLLVWCDEQPEHRSSATKPIAQALGSLPPSLSLNPTWHDLHLGAPQVKCAWRSLRSGSRVSRSASRSALVAVGLSALDVLRAHGVVAVSGVLIVSYLRVMLDERAPRLPVHGVRLNQRSYYLVQGRFMPSVVSNRLDSVTVAELGATCVTNSRLLIARPCCGRVTGCRASKAVGNRGDTRLCGCCSGGVQGRGKSTTLITGASAVALISRQRRREH